MVEIRNPTTLRKSTGVDATEAQGVVDDVASKNEVATKADLIELEGKVKEEMATKVDLEKVEAKLEATIERMARLMIMWICSFIVGYSLALVALAQLFIGK